MCKRIPQPALLLAALGLVASCSFEMATDTLLSDDHRVVPPVPANRLLVTVAALSSPAISVVDAGGKVLEAAKAEACYPFLLGDPWECTLDAGAINCRCSTDGCGKDDQGAYTPPSQTWPCQDAEGGGGLCAYIGPPGPCPQDAPLGSYLVSLPGTESYINLRVVATAGARSFRTLVPEVPRASSVYQAPPVVRGGVIDLESTAVCLLIEAKASEAGLGIGGLPASTVREAWEDILASKARGDEAMVRYFELIALLDGHAASAGSSGPVFVSPAYAPGFEPADPGSSALNPAFIAANPLDYDGDQDRAWVCQPGEPDDRCPPPASCNDGATARYTCEGLRERGSLVRLDWCRCTGGQWVCLEGIERSCPAPPADGTTREHACPAAPEGERDEAFVPGCTYTTFCMDAVRCLLACPAGDDACAGRCRAAIPAGRLAQAEALLACGEDKGCLGEEEPLACLARQENCLRLLQPCLGGTLVCTVGQTQDCDCGEGVDPGTQTCRADRLGWGECVCDEGAAAAEPGPELTEELGRWRCIDHAEQACLVPEGKCDGTIDDVSYLCPATRPGQSASDLPLVPWCECKEQPDADTAAFDQVLKAAAQSFEFAQICFADTDSTPDAPCMQTAGCAIGCAGDAACIEACRAELAAGRGSDLDSLLSCAEANGCTQADGWQDCVRAACPEENARCSDWDGNPDTCWGKTCIVRVVFTTDFREGRKDGNCATLNRFKWTSPGPGPMHFTGGIHRTDTLPISQSERDEIDAMMGDWIPNIIRMHDDGTGGDLEAGDGIWTIVFDLPVGLRISYKYTYGPDGNVWTTTEEWPGNAHIMLIGDLNGDHFVTRHDNYGDEATNKDVANLNNANPDGVLDWDEDVNGDGLPDAAERMYDIDNDCTLDDWKLLSTVTPITVKCPAPADEE